MEAFHVHFIWIVWMNGWQWAATCGVCFSLTQLLQVIILLSTGGANGGGYVLSKYALIGLQAIILVSLGFLNCLPVHYLAYIGNLAMVWNVLGKILMTPNLILPPSLCMFSTRRRRVVEEGQAFPNPLMSIMISSSNSTTIILVYFYPSSISM